MSFRNRATGVALAIAGIAAAVGIGLASNAISGDTVGLSAQPLRAGETLAPDAARDRSAEDARGGRTQPRRRARQRAERAAESSPAAEPVVTDEGGTGAEAGDLTGSGSDDEASDSSGKGSDDSGGSEDSGGADDSGGSEDSSGKGSGGSDD